MTDLLVIEKQVLPLELCFNSDVVKACVKININIANCINARSNERILGAYVENITFDYFLFASLFGAYIMSLNIQLLSQWRHKRKYALFLSQEIIFLFLGDIKRVWTCMFGLISLLTCPILVEVKCF